MDKNNTQNVSAGKGVAGGYFYSAPAGTKPPVGFEPLAEEFVNLGFVTEDGITNGVDEDSDEVKDLNGDTIGSLSSSKTETLQLTLAEVKKETLGEKLGYGNVTEQDGMITALHNSEERDSRVYVADFVLKNGRRWRMVVPNGKVTEVDETVFASSEIIGFGVTITAYVGEDGNSIIDYIGVPKPDAGDIQEA